MGLRTPLIKITDAGAVCVKLTNYSATTAYLGNIVTAAATTLGFAIGNVNETQPIGVVNDSSIDNTSAGWVAFSGIGYGRADSGGFTAGQWVGSGTTVGDLDGDTTPQVTIQHMQEVGHALETATSGQTKRIILHFN